MAKTVPSSPTKPSKAKAQKRVPVVLTPKQRSFLRGLAHAKDPVLQIGKAGSTDAFIAELDRVLETHELVKVRVLRECPTEPAEVIQVAERTLGAALAGKVGRVLTFYRPRRNDPSIVLPKRATHDD